MRVKYFELGMQIDLVNMAYVSWLCLYILCKVAVVKSDEITVTTSLGLIRGKSVQVENKTVLQFLRIPYGKPPIGDLRFKKPQVPDPWNGTLDATKYGPLCMQKITSSWKSFLENYNVSEDCLFLNIYVPNAINKTVPKAVMVYVHGGGYRYKGGSLTDGSKLSLNGDVIVVTINYRLHIFGFFSTEDSASKGNYGLWDQIFALKWVRSNIHNFGGDPLKVTVFGHSAGGYSIGLLCISQETVGLFQRAIPMSGFGLSKRAITHGAKAMAVRIGIKLNCLPESIAVKDVNTTNLTECVSSMTAKSIQDTFNEIYSEDKEEPQYIMRPAPVVDGEILKDTPTKLLSDSTSPSFQRFITLDYMAGINSADGGLIRSSVSVLQQKYNFSMSDGVPTDVLCGPIVNALARDYYNSDKTIASAICSAYTYKGNDTEQGVKTVSMYGDMMYESPAVQTLKIHATSNNHSYYFLFSHKASFVITKHLPKWIIGAYHGDEVVFIFQPSRYNFTQEEKTLSTHLMTYLTNFAKYGNPDNPTSGNKSWPAYTLTAPSYLDIKLNMSVGQNLHGERMIFWENLGKQPRPTSGERKSTPNIISILVLVPALLSMFILYV